MRRRSTALSALAAALLLTAVSAAPAVADDAPATAAPTVPTTSADTPPAAAPTPTGSPTPTPDPVDLTLESVFPGDDVARGSQTDLAFDVIGTSPGATLSLTLPAGVRVADVDIENRAVTCAPVTGVAVCDLGSVSGIQLVNVQLATAAGTPIGTREHVSATVTPVPGPDSNPADNSASNAFTVVGNADVEQTQSVKQINVPLGGSAPFTVFLHNVGPDPATNVEVRFGVNSNDATPPVLNGFSGTAPDRVTEDHGGLIWKPGTIPVGATISLTVTVTTTAPVLDSALSFSSSYDGVREICVNLACLSGAPIRTFVAGTTTPSTGPVLANTGSADRTLTLVAVGLLVAGGGLAAAGRRRRTV